LDLRYSPSEEKFRHEFRSWLQEAVPAHGPAPEAEDWDARREYDTGWQRKLFEAGFAGPSWPSAFGGRAASPTEELVYHEEYARAHAPYVGVNFVGLLHGGPTLIAEGTEEQKAKHVRPILRGEHVWCQGFSEPGSGSDLASLRTSAVRDGDHYVVNGHKIWCSFGQVADYAELLVRTDPDAPKHRGISWLILPMDLPGIEVRPLKTFHGEGEFSELFLSDVRVPVENLVGQENDGWRVTNVTLRFERGTAFVADIFQFREFLDDLVRASRRVLRDDAAAWSDRGLRREVGHLRARLEALWALVQMGVSEAQRQGMPGVGASAVKLAFTEVFNDITDLALGLLGRAGLSKRDVDGLPNADSVYKYGQAISMTIAAGTSQIQRNIIAERILGQPKDR
jgi:alkylation response protein AidB-like acyl-CoA dehydrogenase